MMISRLYRVLVVNTRRSQEWVVVNDDTKKPVLERLKMQVH